MWLAIYATAPSRREWMSRAVVLMRVVGRVILLDYSCPGLSAYRRCIRHDDGLLTAKRRRSCWQSPFGAVQSRFDGAVTRSWIEALELDGYVVDARIGGSP